MPYLGCKNSDYHEIGGDASYGPDMPGLTKISRYRNIFKHNNPLSSKNTQVKQKISAWG